jgi:hypothetical protein
LVRADSEGLRRYAIETRTLERRKGAAPNCRRMRRTVVGMEETNGQVRTGMR